MNQCYESSWQQAFHFPSPIKKVKAMYNAALFGLQPLVEQLLQSEFNVNDTLLQTTVNVDGLVGASGWTALHAASYARHTAQVKTLVAKGASIEARATNKDWTPLHVAAETAKEHVVKALVSAGASVHATSSSGTTAFCRATRAWSATIMEFLYKVGSDINVKTVDHWTPVFEAIELDREDALDLLLSWGFDLQVLNDLERIPLSTAALLLKQPNMIEKIANKLRHEARTEGPSNFADRADPDALGWHLDQCLSDQNVVSVAHLLRER